MDKYISKTGYVKNIKTGEYFETNMIYIGCNASIDDFVDITKEEYDDYWDAMLQKFIAKIHS